jgi:hypothetical protein
MIFKNSESTLKGVDGGKYRFWLCVRRTSGWLFAWVCADIEVRDFKSNTKWYKIKKNL